MNPILAMISLLSPKAQRETNQSLLNQESKPEIDTSQNESEGFPVFLDGKTLFTIKVDARTTSAKQRAELVTATIKKIAKDYSIKLLT